MEKTVIAAIVTYNPVIARLNCNITSLTNNNIKEIVIIDNNSKNIEEIAALAGNDNNAKISLIRNQINEGIGKALNQAVIYAGQRGYQWLLTLDQDSICDVNYISPMLDLLLDDVGIVYPTVIDRRQINIDNENLPESWTRNFKRHIRNFLCNTKIDTPITSGALMNIRALNQVGGYDEYMFIDGVDFDIALKLQRAHYRIVHNHASTLEHQLGNPCMRKLWWGTINASGHSQKRVYYMTRNACYLFQRYRSFSLKWCVFNIGRAILCGLKNAIVSQRYKDYFCAIYRGIIDGRRTKIYF